MQLRDQLAAKKLAKSVSGKISEKAYRFCPQHIFNATAKNAIVTCKCAVSVCYFESRIYGQLLNRTDAALTATRLDKRHQRIRVSRKKEGGMENGIARVRNLH